MTYATPREGGPSQEDPRSEARQNDHRHGGRKRFPERPRRDDERRGERPNQQQRPPRQEYQSRQERQPDPNSPFAKLLELKQRMEAEKNKP